MLYTRILLLFIGLLSMNGCGANNPSDVALPTTQPLTIVPGSYHFSEYLPLLKGKKVAIVANASSMIGRTHLVDTLLALGMDIRMIFGPEHGYKGNYADGKEIANERTENSGITIISLYGDHKKPTQADLTGIDVVLFDIQDVGVRFYTYISTLSYVMEACAENSVPLIITDRPNPHGYYVDGPVLKPEFASFVGLHPVPIVYGLTIGEYAEMVNGEHWLSGQLKCELRVIKCSNYTHKSLYVLPDIPSPNLRTPEAIMLYPSLCLLEGTVMSIGRGTPNPFTLYGHPQYKNTNIQVFTPKPIPGVSDNPPLKGLACNGKNVQNVASQITLEGKLWISFLIDAFNNTQITEGKFFTNYFNKLAGNSLLQKQITDGLKPETIRQSWQSDIQAYKKIRKKYLLYPDFE